ncbi:PAS domain-containing sensor histidine kinase [Pontibacter sp. HSC-36F09]|uniref:sensor histidine kinase n=1 Tax=Pontibacter sp. HSC-36F09 TaxID=2910966 RepID=UPI0020A10951|nr:HAMP domain-containing sensor histidine kinase [Pontibacter sp. HSC-36F09]MCP2044017.1 signal transduction histidine kinase [Pontibacter sp. HSC-36F09]
MSFNSYESKLSLRVALLVITLSLPALLLLKQWTEALVFILPVIIFQVYELIQFHKRAQAEFQQFIQSIHYRDFSIFFDENHASSDLKILRHGFNEISSTFKSISLEKQTQYQNLQKITELIDTGIMTYALGSGEILLMNESLKNLLHVPHMKSVHALEKRDLGLYLEVQQLQPGQTKIATAHTAQRDKRTIKVLLSAATFQNEGIQYKLVAFQNINEALDETESQAWQKLLNVMTHEIMNSVAPISSLADTLKNRLQHSIATGINQDDVEDLEIGISTIKRRSEGLLRFAETYRNLNKITTLNLDKVYVRELFSNLSRLMQPTLAQKNISLEINLKDQDLALQADPNLLDQALINLVVNAIDAVKDSIDPMITLSALKASNGKVVIRVSDNGKGMSEEVQEKIFIPFFSTRKQGSGIGLSLCKQIVMLHNGTIQVQSEEGEGTVFILRFG